MTSLPRAARWVTWFNAWLDGSVPIDDATAAVLDEDAAHDVIGLDDGPIALSRAWLSLRSRGAAYASLALPEPGDPAGLAGPPDFNEMAIDAGEAAIIAGPGFGFVPTVVGSGVFWQMYPATVPVAHESTADAERQLREQLVRTGRDLAELDVARWRPEVADALASLREPRSRILPPGYDERAQRVVALAARCLHIGELALTDDGAAIGVRDASGRRAAIEDLRRSARHAVIVACDRAERR